jgi:hypothetical protein
MKKGILFVLMMACATVTVNAQTLKDLLYSGKLKNDSGSVVRKSDDLSTKIDTVKKKAAEPGKAKITSTVPVTAAVSDSSVKESMASADSTSLPVQKTEENKDNSAAPVVVVKDNNKLWKEYMDSVVSTLKTEVLPSKRIKKGTYYVMVDYVIGTDGQVTINNVYPAPDNSFLQQQVKERLTLTAPKLNPVIWSNGQPHKAVKRYNFTLSKE